MNEISIRSALEGWGNEDLSNLKAILKIADTEDDTLTVIETELKWLYHSKARAQAKLAGVNAKNFLLAKTNKSKFIPLDEEDTYQVPSYSDIVTKCCKKLKLDISDDILTLETYIAEFVIANALVKMTCEDRHKFFNTEIEAKNILARAGIKNNNFNSVKNTMVLLSLANSAGFGLYATATTALGFATHAIGVTLPFAAYTGLTSTIAFLIGPVGWLSLGFWTLIKLTDSDIKSLIPAVLYISSVNSRLKLKETEGL